MILQTVTIRASPQLRAPVDTAYMDTLLVRASPLSDIIPSFNAHNLCRAQGCLMLFARKANNNINTSYNNAVMLIKTRLILSSSKIIY